MNTTRCTEVFALRELGILECGRGGWRTACLNSKAAPANSKSDSQFRRGASLSIMEIDEAKILLGFPPNSVPSQSQIKSAYRRKVWETHPDRFPPHLKARAESKFKMLSEAYTFLNSPGGSRRRVPTASYSRVVRTGVANRNVGRGSMRGASLPFLLITFGALALGGSTASRAYRRQKEAHPCFNPFLP